MQNKTYEEIMAPRAASRANKAPQAPTAVDSGTSFVKIGEKLVAPLALRNYCKIHSFVFQK
jgi:hypothetical protein